nr:FCD domain-containing protein [Streptomyces canus]
MLTSPRAHRARSRPPTARSTRRSATHNPQIARLSRDLLTRISLGFPVEPWGKGERSQHERAGHGHTALYEAVAAGAPERAQEIAREHFMISAEMIREVLARVRGRSGTEEGPD